MYASLPRNAFLENDSDTDESLVKDARAEMRPAQVVEGKLRSMLKHLVLPVSHIRTSSAAPLRTHC